MYFGIGFLVAALVGLLIVPLVHGRAVRLTRRRLEAATPLSMAEIQADKDQLRAEFAMSTRRLEMSVEQMKTKTTSQQAELGKKSDSINKLKLELGEKAAAIFALEAREKMVRDQLRATEEEFSVKTRSLREAEEHLAVKEAEFAQAAIRAKSVSDESHRVETAALQAHVEALKAQVGSFMHEVKETGFRLSAERDAASDAAKHLGTERGKTESLGNRVSELERELSSQRKESGLLGKRAQELEARLSDQSRFLAEREFECGQLRSQIDAARKTEADLRADVAAASDRQRLTIEHLRSEKAGVEDQLKHSREEEARLAADLTAIKRDTEASWAQERVENALLRERINDVAAEVARLTVALEGENSPIETILAETWPARAPGSNGDTGAKVMSANESKGSLVERIRALQSRASRISQPG